MWRRWVWFSALQNSKPKTSSVTSETEVNIWLRCSSWYHPQGNRPIQTPISDSKENKGSSKPMNRQMASSVECGYIGVRCFNSFQWVFRAGKEDGVWSKHGADSNMDRSCHHFFRICSPSHIQGPSHLRGRFSGKEGGSTVGHSQLLSHHYIPLNGEPKTWGGDGK